MEYHCTAYYAGVLLPPDLSSSPMPIEADTVILFYSLFPNFLLIYFGLLLSKFGLWTGSVCLSIGNSLEMQISGPVPDLFNRNLCFNKIPR